MEVTIRLDGIGAFPAVEFVIDNLIAVDQESVVTALAVKLVITASAVDDIVFFAAFQLIIAVGALDDLGFKLLDTALPGAVAGAGTAGGAVTGTGTAGGAMAGAVTGTGTGTAGGAMAGAVTGTVTGAFLFDDGGFDADVDGGGGCTL